MECRYDVNGDLLNNVMCKIWHSGSGGDENSSYPVLLRLTTKKKTLCCSKTSLTLYHSARRNVPKDFNYHQHRCDILIYRSSDCLHFSISFLMLSHALWSMSLLMCFLGAFAQLRQVTISFVVSVRPSALNN